MNKGTAVLLRVIGAILLAAHAHKRILNYFRGQDK